MKKHQVVLLFLVSMLLMPAQALAVDFTIEDSRIDARLQENGDVQVTELHIYAFEGKFNGITRSLIPKEDSAIEDFQASEDGKPLRVEQDDELYKIFRSGSDETITVNLSYTIINGMELYADLGQFYWPFFDTSNEATYENMDIYVHPPMPTDDVLATGYDKARGTAEIRAGGTVHFAMGEVEDGENGDIRVAYDSDLFPGAAQVSNSNIREDILIEQKKLEEQAAAFERRKDSLESMAPFVASAALLYLLILLFIAWMKKRSTAWEVERSSMQNSILPKEEMSLPAIIHYMGGLSKGGEILSASLLNLVRKGFIERKQENEFVVVNKETDYEHERLLIDWLFYKVGNDGTFSPEDVEAYTNIEENKETYQTDYNNWLAAVKNEMDQHDLYEKKAGLRWTVALSSFLLIPLVILFGIYELPMWLFIFLFLFAGLIGFAAFYHPRSVKGTRIKKQWDQFASKYDNITEQQWSEWMNDEQMQAFIYAIGTNDKKMMEKNKTLIETAPANATYGLTTSDMVIFLILSGTLTDQFNEANQIVAASGANASAGTGAGIGGGGGGSGAF